MNGTKSRRLSCSLQRNAVVENLYLRVFIIIILVQTSVVYVQNIHRNSYITFEF